MRVSLLSLLATTILSSLLAATTAHAQPRLLQVRFDNDTFAGLDRWYSNRVDLSWTAPLTRRTHLQLRGGQVMYTPRNIQRTDPPTRDLAFGAWLYAEAAALHHRRAHTAQLRLRLGVLGPYAGARSVQTAIHAMLGVRRPRGWHNQLEHHVGGELGVTYALHPGIQLDGLLLVPAALVGLDLGNVHQRAILGLGLSLSHGIPASAAFLDPRLSRGHRCPRICGALHLGARVRLAWQDAFVDGDRAPAPPAITRRPWVLELRGGFRLGGRRAWVRYLHVRETRAFDLASGDDLHPPTHRYGILELGVPY